MMDRRNFLSAGLAMGAAAAALGTATVGCAANPPGNAPGAAAVAAAASTGGKFKLKYAPTFRMFKELGGEDPIDQIKFCADQGFRALFDNSIGKREVEEQKKIGKEMARLGMELGPFGGSGAPSFVETGPEIRDGMIQAMKNAIEISKRVNGKWVLVVPGDINLRLEPDYQTANVIENCRICCDVLEKSGLVMVLEPLNAWRNHPGRFLQKIPHAYLICEAVNHPCCKIVNDLYHQQITEGNLIPNIDRAWKHIAAFHTGDTPGRKEPGTGEINYRNVFKHIYEKGYEGVLCMEHGASQPGREGEQAVIDAYRVADAF